MYYCYSHVYVGAVVAKEKIYTGVNIKIPSDDLPVCAKHAALAAPYQTMPVLYGRLDRGRCVREKKDAPDGAFAEGRE